MPTLHENRLARIDAIELKTAGGAGERDRIKGVFDATGARELEIDCYGPDKYGRHLVELIVKSTGENINDLLGREGHAIYA